MKQINNVQIYGLEESIRRAKFPMSVDANKPTIELTSGINSLGLAEIGSGHDNFLNGIIVQFDLTATIKMWTEMERYHFIDFVSSQSTIHRITKFDLNTAYSTFVDPDIIDIMKKKVDMYNNLTDEKDAEAKKNLYLEILYSNPCGMFLTAGMTTNYRQLKTIYKQRKYHKLPEWREFCKWLETLPHSEWITGT